MSELIQIENLSKVFQTRTGDVAALSHVDLGIRQGEFVSILGPSGCGKTTLLRILAGLEHHTDGSATISGVPIGEPRGEAGMVFQKATLLPWLNILDNVLLPLSLKRRVSTADRAHAIQLLTLVGLADFVSKHPQELSGGMQQRAAICRALVHDPAVLLMDEPFGALDAMTRDALNVEVNRIWRETGTTAVLITHSISEAIFLGQRVVVMTPRPGQIAEVVDVPFGPDRSLELLGDPQFAALTSHVRRHFEVTA